MSAPVIPQRPARSQNAVASPSSEAQQPRVPPRPVRHKDRSVSPNTDRYARSPLNDWSNYRNGKIQSGSTSSLTASLPQRPPSVDLPSIGQEGNEYAVIPESPTTHPTILTGPGSPPQFKAAGDIPMHQPKASVPAQVAKTRVASVTRTDSDQAAALGIGKPASYEPSALQKQEPRSQSRPPSSAAASRPASIMQSEEHEHGIPSFGIQVPMYPNAGDVQAPTPSPYELKPHGSGVGFFNDGSHAQGRRHERTKSGQRIFTGPPGSYGLHGHGKTDRDQFENDWYAKHPEEAKRESRGAYGPAISDGRKEWALSSEDLNKLVREGGAKLPNTGTSTTFIGTPDEYVGYQASEEYASRIHSPRPPSAGGLGLHKTRTGSGTAHAESPLRKMSFPVNEHNPIIKRNSVVENALDTEDEDDVIHVEPLSRVQSKYTGAGFDYPTEDLGPHGGNTEAEGGIFDEQGYGVPILASDEVAKRPGMEWLQPAVPPEQERNGDEYYAGVDSEGKPVYKSGHSRPQSRNNSVAALQRFTSHEEGTHTPLDALKEYEPLFPEEEENAKKASQGKPLRRPDLARHHFPSKDVWEDTPSSLMYVTTVETPPPDADRQLPQPTGATKTFEPPEAEAARKDHLTQDDREDFLSEHTKRFSKSRFNKDVMGDMATRPGLQHRFPSQDVWEDTPSESMMTTVITGDSEQDREVEAPEVEKDAPQIPNRPVKAQQPTVPPRPAKVGEKEPLPTEARKAPVIPDRPKPQVPTRPAKTRDAAEPTPLAKVSSVTSDRSTGSEEPSEGAVLDKKPPPPKPVKQFGGIKGGFISELQNKLQLGPQAPKKEAPPPEAEQVEEKAPLADARKGRARGPQRRKPGVSPSAAAATESSTASGVTSSVVTLGSIFEIDDEGILAVGKAVPSQLTAPSTATEAAPAADAPATQPEPELEYFNPGSPETSVKHQASTAPEEAGKEPLLPPAEIPMSEASEAQHESIAEQQPETSTEQSTQTGQQEIEAGFEGEEKQKVTAYVDAHPQEGNVVTRDVGASTE